MVRFDAGSRPGAQPAQPRASTDRRPGEADPAPAAGPSATPQPSPTPAGPRWQGWVVSNSSGQQQGTGIWSVIVVRVLNWAGVPVTHHRRGRLERHLRHRHQARIRPRRLRVRRAVARHLHPAARGRRRPGRGRDGRPGHGLCRVRRALEA